MSVAFDASSSSLGTDTGNFSWTHTPAGTPRAVIVWVIGTAFGTDLVSGVTYGGVAMTEVAGSPNLKATGEVTNVHCFFLGASVPSGAQSVAVTTTGGGAKIGFALTQTATGDVEIIDTDATINSDAVVDPSATLVLGGRTCFCAIGLYSGRLNVGSITAFTGWTERSEFDFGADVAGCYSYNTIDTADVAAGWTQTSDDAVAISIAVSEVVGAGGDAGSILPWITWGSNVVIGGASPA